MLARLRALGVALIRFSGEPRVISGWGGAAEEMFGYSAADAVGRLPEELPIAPADVTQRLREALMRIPETPLEYDLRLLRKDGTTFPARVRSGFDFRADGSIAGTCSLVLDTSAARAPGEHLPATSSLGPVAALGTLAIGGIERAELVARATKIVAESLAIELVAVFAVDAESGVLRFEGGRGWAGEERPAERMPLAGTDAAALLRTGTGVVVTDTAPSWTQGGLFARSGARDGISVAIGDPFRPTGALVAFARGERQFSVAEVGFLQATSHVLAAAHERERARDLDTRFQRLSRIEAMGQLTGGIAHDFNNLLSVILNHAAFAREHVQGAGSEGSIDEIEAAATRAAELTRQLLVFSRQEVVATEVVDVAEAVAGAERMLRRTLGEGYSIETTLESDLRAIEAGAGQIEQIVVNLAVNARDAMPNGGTIRISVERAGRSDAEHRWVRLTVSDDGVGMSAAVQEKAFEPFFTTKPIGEGSGLGLATVYGIVSGLGGSIELASEPGAGTDVDILLPVAGEAAAAGIDAPVPAASAAGGEAAARRVLLVEDDAMVRRLTERVLVEAGYDVEVAAGPERALELLVAAEARFAVLLTDIVMPGLSGVELARHVRELDPGIGIVFMSGYTGDTISRDAVRDLEAGFVEKPFTPETLLEGVAAAFEAIAPGG